MDELERNGNAEYESSELPKEPEPNTYTPPAEQPAPGFYAWSGTQLPRQEPPAQRSPFANSPYVRVTPEQPRPYQPAQPQTPPVPPQEPPVAPPPQPPRVSAPPQPPRQPRKSSGMALAALLASVGLFAISVGLCIGNSVRIDRLESQHQKQLASYSQKVDQLEDALAALQKSPVTKPQQGTNQDQTQQPDASGALTPAQVYSQCVNSVVAINCKGAAAGAFGQIMETASSGSGFVLSADGYIVTNYHVVEDSSYIEISMYDGTTYEAEYIGGNEANDIALIKVDAENLQAVTIGSSSELIVGDQVAAIGNPLGELASTLTVGYVSAKDRIVTSEGTQINMLQTDAAINPGNSGGPLFNMYGEVVGITSAKYSGTTNSGATIEGIGFAIPTDDVMMMLEDLKNFGYITGGYLGVTVSEVSEEAYQLYGLPQGVLIREVMPGSCSEKAGLRAQDIIIELGGYEVTNLNSLSRALNKCKAGEEVKVTVYRSGSEVELNVILDERPHEEAEPEPQVTEPAPTEQYAPWPGDEFLDDWFGSFFG